MKGLEFSLGSDSSKVCHRDYQPAHARRSKQQTRLRLSVSVSVSRPTSSSRGRSKGPCLCTRPVIQCGDKSVLSSRRMA
jgi:hypothetical protein